MKRINLLVIMFCLVTGFSLKGFAEKGYYRFPAIHGNLVVFTAEGDLWQFNRATGQTMRLTTHQGLESYPSISPDGQFIAFNAEYEGPSEVYVIPVNGGVPRRLTWEGLNSGAPRVNGWTRDGKIIVSTGYFSTLPSKQLALLDPQTRQYQLLPLAQADEGDFDPNGTLYFTRLAFNGSQTKRYKGGTAQNLWKFDGKSEAVPLTADYPGASKNPMFWNGRLYFLTDRDNTMNLWSMKPDGTDLKQHTRSSGWDLKNAQLSDGNIIYQKQADLYVFNIETGKEELLGITLLSDFDQRRVYWEKDPMGSLQNLSLSNDGKNVVLVSAGRVFNAPVDGTRWVELTRKYGVRYKDAKFIGPDNRVTFLSDESGEMEIWETAKDGFGHAEQLTRDSKVLIMEQIPSPDGNYIAYTEKDYALKLFDVKAKFARTIDQDSTGGFQNIIWSADSKWLSYVDPADNQMGQIKVMNVKTGESFYLTSDRTDSNSPVFSPDSKWLYFISDRTWNPTVRSPWGLNQPEPYYEKTSKIYMLALYPDLRSPFLADDELTVKKDDKKEGDKKEADDKKKKKEEPKKPEAQPDFAGAKGRLYELPVPANNINGLAVTDKAVFWMQSAEGGRSLYSLEISNKKDNKPGEVADRIWGYELSGDGKKMMIRKSDGIYVLDAKSGKASLTDAKVTLKDWSFRVDPVESWRQMMVDAWRLERDYFYDKNMHGVDWPKVLERHLPLIDRVTDRWELDDLLASMVSELSALHTFVYGGNKRTSPDRIRQGSLGARLTRDDAKGGYVIDRIFAGDPEFIEERSPLAELHLKIKTGDVITKIDGVDVLTVGHINELLSQKAGVDVRLTLKNAQGEGYDQVVTPFSMSDDANLRYHEWEYTRREQVETETGNQVAYLHLRAMGGDDFENFVKGFYPAFNRQGLIIDVRNNRGGNIDSWVISRLMRKAWFYWQSRAGKPTWNMQYAFRGHIVVLCNEQTASDGEAFAEGIKQLNIGTVMGTRTWGGEIWLSSGNRLVDNGIATAAEMGVYTEKDGWIIEGHGVEPHLVIDNLPYTTFNGKDTQLEAAIELLKKKIAEQPVTVPKVPAFPNLSVEYDN